MTTKSISYSGARISVRRVTPQIASTMLDKNTHNRPLRERNVRRFASAMSSGKWRFNGDTICLNGDQLIDGQHRLEACVRSGIPFHSIVVEGLESETFSTKDCGKTRSIGDVLEIVGCEHSKKLARALIMLESYYSDRITSFRFRVECENYDIEKLAKRYETAAESLKLCLPIDRTRIMSASALAACHYIFSQINQELADTVIDQVITGAGLSKRSPIRLFRDRMIADLNTKPRMRQEYAMALLIKAWNAVRQNKQIQKLFAKIDGEFPDAI